MRAEPGLCDPPLQLAPTRALLRGFEFGLPQASGDAPALAAAATNAADPTQGGPLLREGFRLGQLRLMIRYEDGSELLDLPAVYRLPNAPAWFLGMANLHGALVPVFDLAELFGVVHDSSAKPMLLVLGHGLEKAGVLIDGLPLRLRSTAHERVDAALPELLQGCIADAYRIGDHDWLDLSYAPLFERLEAQLAG